MEKYCKECNKTTSHSDGKCNICKTAKVTVREICDRMGVCRQAVYLKSDRKGFGKRKVKPTGGKGKDIRVYTEEEARILVEEDDRYKREPVESEG